MGHLPKLIEDLALILIVAAFVVLIFRKIKQPLVLGYIIAGFLVSPNFKIFPSVVDMTNIKTLAEIGVIFLLFSLGLEFSFKKLMNVGGSASITAFVEIIFITIAGYTPVKCLAGVPWTVCFWEVCSPVPPPRLSSGLSTSSESRPKTSRKRSSGFWSSRILSSSY